MNKHEKLQKRAQKAFDEFWEFEKSYNKIRRSLGIHYPGELIQHNWKTIPSGIRVINLEGQTIPINDTYAKLADAVYVGDRDNQTAEGFYKTKDAKGKIRSTSGKFMKLPNSEKCENFVGEFFTLGIWY